jgi:hypothetical protein
MAWDTVIQGFKSISPVFQLTTGFGRLQRDNPEHEMVAEVICGFPEVEKVIRGFPEVSFGTTIIRSYVATLQKFVTTLKCAEHEHEELAAKLMAEIEICEKHEHPTPAVSFLLD